MLPLSEKNSRITAGEMAGELAVKITVNLMLQDSSLLDFLK
ncbi:hypothetical protein NY78_3707 [Desulfovibrio sp. TomC]|nr:hypothetical protein NY78_3707 [Desulfovibrio sp. TomC]